MHPLRDYQIQSCNDIEAAAAAGHRGIVLQAVTGAGKTRMMIELMQRARRRQQRAAVYTNRRMLLNQLHEVFDYHGVQHGQRAAGRQKQLSRDVQLCMMQSERRKVLQSKERMLHEADLVIVDEAHINAQGGALEIIKRHQDAGATVVLFSATPVGLGHVATTIIHGCSSSQARLAGATLPARCYAIEEPSKNLVRRVATGEEEIAGKLRRQYCQMIVGRVEEEWRKLNPQGLPTILFGPDVASSQWLADSLWKKGIDACHIDAKGIYADGRRQDGEAAKERLIKEFKDCERQIICNRFVMREGIDICSIYHAILATRFGSETSYLQAVGRALRNDPSLPGHVICADHGGNLWDYLSPNIDRTWSLTDAPGTREYEIRWDYQTGQEREPLVCQECHGMRRSGTTCPFCGHVATGPTVMRRVLMHDGQLRLVQGSKHRKAPTAPVSYKQLWERKYWSHRKGKKLRSFKQAFTAFGYEVQKQTGRYCQPGKDWRFMPKFGADHKLAVRDVPMRRLVGFNRKGVAV